MLSRGVHCTVSSRHIHMLHSYYVHRTIPYAVSEGHKAAVRSLQRWPDEWLVFAVVQGHPSAPSTVHPIKRWPMCGPLTDWGFAVEWMDIRLSALRIGWFARLFLGLPFACYIVTFCIIFCYDNSLNVLPNLDNKCSLRECCNSLPNRQFGPYSVWFSFQWHFLVAHFDSGLKMYNDENR